MQFLGSQCPILDKKDPGAGRCLYKKIGEKFIQAIMYFPWLIGYITPSL